MIDLITVQLRQKLAGMVDYGHTDCSKSIDLMNQHLSTTVVCVVGDHTPWSERSLFSVDHLQQL
jgi:hypothetical protein